MIGFIKKNIRNKSVAGILIFLLVGVQSYALIPPQHANALLSGILGDTFTCAVGGFGAGLVEDILGSLNLTSGSISDLFGLGGGLLGGFLSSTVPVIDETQIAIQEQQVDIQKSLQFKEYVLDCIVWAVTSSITEAITGQIINWVNTGNSGIAWVFDGIVDEIPFYIDDPLGFFSNLSDRVTEDFISDFRNDFDPSGISAYKDILSDVLIRERLQKNTLGDVLQPTVDKEFFSDFNEGSWDAYFESVTNPANDPLRLHLALNSIADTRVAAATADQEKLLDYGDGFFPDVDGSGYVVTPGQTIRAQLDEVLNTGLTQLESADELAELLAALADLLVNALVDDLEDGVGGSGGGLRNVNLSQLGGGILETVNPEEVAQSSSALARIESRLQTVENEISVFAPDIVPDVITLREVVDSLEALVNDFGVLPTQGEIENLKTQVENLSIRGFAFGELSAIYDELIAIETLISGATPLDSFLPPPPAPIVTTPTP